MGRFCNGDAHITNISKQWISPTGYNIPSGSLRYRKLAPKNPPECQNFQMTCPPWGRMTWCPYLADSTSFTNGTGGCWCKLHQTSARQYPSYRAPARKSATSTSHQSHGKDSFWPPAFSKNPRASKEYFGEFTSHDIYLVALVSYDWRPSKWAKIRKALNMVARCDQILPGMILSIIRNVILMWHTESPNAEGNLRVRFPKLSDSDTQIADSVLSQDGTVLTVLGQPRPLEMLLDFLQTSYQNIIELMKIPVLCAGGLQGLLSLLPAVACGFDVSPPPFEKSQSAAAIIKWVWGRSWSKLAPLNCDDSQLIISKS